MTGRRTKNWKQFHCSVAEGHHLGHCNLVLNGVVHHKCLGRLVGTRGAGCHSESIGDQQPVHGVSTGETSFTVVVEHLERKLSDRRSESVVLGTRYRPWMPATRGLSLRMETRGQSRTRG